MFGHDDPLKSATESLQLVAREDRSAWSGAARSARLLELADLAERVNAELIRAVGEWDAIGAWAEDGATSGAAWLAYRAPMTHASAARLMRSARLVRKHEKTAAALAVGEISTPHVDLIARVTRHREDLYPEGEDALLRSAEALSPDNFAAIARRWRSLADDSLAQEEAHELFERRHLHVSTTLYGTVRIDGELDPEGGSTFLNALDALAPPDSAAGDVPPRSTSQRRADALVDLASRSLACSPSGGRSRVRADLVQDVNMLAGRAGDLTALRCDLARVGPIAPVVAQRLLCDADVGRVIMRGSSEILDLGRRSRLVSHPLWRALT
ncbi:MAG TPA: DUF222 domain-containing protein, partial [Acidimicrobiia bacterium]